MKNKDSDTFRKIIAENYKTVQKWPEWKRNITISAYSASTGRFIKDTTTKEKK